MNTIIPSHGSTVVVTNVVLTGYSTQKISGNLKLVSIPQAAWVRPRYFRAQEGYIDPRLEGQLTILLSNETDEVICLGAGYHIANLEMSRFLQDISL